MSNGKKRGRPRKNEAHTIAITTKLSDDEIDKLVYIMEEFDMTMSEALRFSLNRAYTELINE